MTPCQALGGDPAQVLQQARDLGVKASRFGRNQTEAAHRPTVHHQRRSGVEADRGRSQDQRIVVKPRVEARVRHPQNLIGLKNGVTAQRDGAIRLHQIHAASRHKTLMVLIQQGDEGRRRA